MEQWVFVLPGADSQSECTFFANPSIAGYDVEDGAAVNLIVDFGEKVYTVALSKTDRKNWYASETYSIAKSAWKKDYTVRVEIKEKDGTTEKVELSKAEVTASWPEIREKTVKLEKDSAGQTQNEIHFDRWIQGNLDSSLFEYKAEDQNGCDILIDAKKQTVSIYNVESKGEFTLAIVDPAGNEEVAEMSVIAAAGTGKGFGMGIVVLALAAVAVIAVLLLKKKPGTVGTTAKEERLLEAREAIEKCCGRLESLKRKSENLLREIRETGQSAEDRIRRDGEASAYDINDIHTMMEGAENLVKEPCCENIDAMRVILGGVSQNLLKMQGNARVKKDNNSHSELDNPRNYLDAVKRQEILDKIEMDAVSVENLCDELNTILETLKEIAWQEEVPFETDITITVTYGQEKYETMRACREAYGAMAPGGFMLDTLRFLFRSETWVTLPEIIGKRTNIRIFAIDNERMRAIAEKSIIDWQGKSQRIIEFSYDEDVVFGLKDCPNTEIRFHFGR